MDEDHPGSRLRRSVQIGELDAHCQITRMDGCVCLQVHTRRFGGEEHTYLCKPLLALALEIAPSSNLIVDTEFSVWLRRRKMLRMLLTAYR